MPKSIKITFFVSKSDFASAMFLHYRYRRIYAAAFYIMTALILTSIGIIGFGKLYSEPYIQHDGWLLLIIQTALLAFAICYLYYLNPFFKYREYSRRRGKQTAELKEGHLVITSSDLIESIALNHIKCVRNSNHVVLLYVSNNHFYIVPKSAFANIEDLNSFSRHFYSQQ